VNLNAKNMSVGLHKTNDAPKGPVQRALYRDVMKRAVQKMNDAGIPMTMADAQASAWYNEQSLYKRAGALRKKSDNVDYLDSAHALVQQQQKSPGRPTVAPPKGKVKSIKLVPAEVAK
jgi:hypothetical protein